MAILALSGPFDGGRGARVVSRTGVFLDAVFPVEGTSYGKAAQYRAENGAM